LDAEVSVLGAALLTRAAASDAVELLVPEDFYRNAHRVVFEAVRELTRQGEPVDTVTITDWLARRDRLDEVGGAAALHDLTMAVPTAANAAYYARIVRDKALLRRLIDAGTAVTRLGYEASDDARSVVDRAESLVYEVAQTTSVSEYQRLGELLNHSFEQIEALAERGSEVTGLATGFDDLDRLTAGLQPQNLVILAARPAMGKSSLALAVCHFVTARLQRPAMLFSLEMSKLEIVNRLLSSEARIDSSRLRTGRLEDTDWRKLGDALGALADAPFYIDDTPSISLMEIRAKARRLKQKHGLDLVVVDYLQLMQSHRRVDNRQQEVAEISRGLKMLAKELDVPVIALSQLSRQPESRTDKRPQLADLRESGCLTRGTRLWRADTGKPTTFGSLLDEGSGAVEVWALGPGGRLVAGRVTNVFASGIKPVYRVRLRSGTVVEATANHPFRTLGGWTPLGELEVGDRVATARSVPPPRHPIGMDPDEVVLLAHLIGEGTLARRQALHYTSADPANLAAVRAAARRRFGISAVARPDGRSAVTTQLYLPAPFHLTHGRRNPIAAWLDELGLWGCRAWEKRIPAEVFALDDAQLRDFLHHLWATDGCVHVRERADASAVVSLYYATSSGGLAQDLLLLLRRIGIVAKIRTVRGRDGARDGHQVWVYGASAQRRFLQEVGVHGARSVMAARALEVLEGRTANPNVGALPIGIWDTISDLRRERGVSDRHFQAALGGSYCGTTLLRSAPSRQRLARIAEVLDANDLRQLATDDLFWDEIVTIEPLGPQPVFDATVAEHHSFVAEGVVLHNSIEQDADIVGFIYRDEVYDEDSPDKGIAELIIAKHRNGATGVVKLAFLDHLTKFANLARGPRGSTGGGGGGGQPPPPTPI
jgi:replicative DNA helicase